MDVKPYHIIIQYSNYAYHGSINGGVFLLSEYNLRVDKSEGPVLRLSRTVRIRVGTHL
jgi:hypothetical protein